MPTSTREHAALAAALDPIITIDVAGTIQSASDSVLRVLGWTPAELIGRNVSILMPEPHRSAHDGYLTNYARTGQTSIMNQPRRLEALHKDGSRLPVELCISRAEMPAGMPPMFVGIIRDMTAYAAMEYSRDEERVRYQKQLAEQTAALHSAHQALRATERLAALGTLAAGLGHDMGNLILPIRMRLDLLERSAIPAEALEDVAAIAASVAYLQRLSNGLKLLAVDPNRSRAGPDTDPAAPPEVKVGAVTNLASWWAEVRPVLAAALPPGVVLAQTATDWNTLPEVAIPPAALAQAVFNLVQNAGEAMASAPGRTGEVRITAHGVQPIRLHIEVADNGPGMSPEVLDHCMEPFYSTKSRRICTGMGLSLVKGLVEQAGGSVQIASKQGQGTTFTLDLPTVTPPVDPAPPAPSTSEVTVPPATPPHATGGADYAPASLRPRPSPSESE